MNIKDLWVYQNMTNLISNLSYLHTSDSKYKLALDSKKENYLYFYFDKEKKKYVLEVHVSDKIKLKLKTKKAKYTNIKNKTLFIKLLREKITLLLDILQKSWYVLTYQPEVSIFDLEMLSQEIDDSKEELEEKDLKKNKKILNLVLIYHEIMPQYLSNNPKLENWSYNIKINSIKKENIELFPKQDKYFKNVRLDVSALPNVYFSGIISLKIEKSFIFKWIKFNISYFWQILSKDISVLAKNYYEDYKLAWDDRVLSFSLKLVEIIKNPYNKEHLTKTWKDEVLTRSNCPKCWSSSSLFIVELSNVMIRTKMWKFEVATLYWENVINHKDILSVECYECHNKIIEDKNLKENIIKRRRFLETEDWISFDTWKPLLDSDKAEEIIVKYDIVKIEVEFDTTNPLLPKLEYWKILDVWKIIGWSDLEQKRTKVFYTM